MYTVKTIGGFNSTQIDLLRVLPGSVEFVRTLESCRDNIENEYINDEYE
jgi:hypothetical protein